MKKKFHPCILLFCWLGCSTLSLAQVPGNLRVAGLQMNVSNDIAANKTRILSGIRDAAAGKANFLITPEGSLSGYRSTFDQKELEPALNEVLVLARALKLGMLLGTCFKDEEGLCYNQIRIYSPEGSFLGAHSKILVCSPVDKPGTGEMEQYTPGTLQTFEWNQLRFGALVCNDLWATPGYTTILNPYLPLRLKEMGAQVIFHAINSGTSQKYRPFHESSAELWALHLGIPIMEVNAAYGDKKGNAQSGLIDRQGGRAVKVPDSGDQLFFCDIEVGAARQ